MLDETYAAILEANKEIADLKAEIQHLRTERERELGNDMLRVLHDCSVSAYAAVKAERDELRQMLDGCDIAGPELMAENEKLREECVSSRAAFEAILKFQDCNYGPAWNMQKIARAQLIQAEQRGLSVADLIEVFAKKIQEGKATIE